MHNKQKIIKSGFFTFSTVLVLVVATVAWFISGGNHAGTDTVQAEILSNKYSTSYYESPDLNKDGQMDDPATWVAIDGPNLDINGMVPGEKHFYKIVITTSNQPLTLTLSLDDIVITPLAPTTKAQLLQHINMTWAVKDSAEATIPGTTPFNGSMYTFFGGNPDLTTKTVYSLVDLSTYLDTTVTIYYNIGITGGTAAGADDLLQGASVDIGNLNLTIADK